MLPTCCSSGIPQESAAVYYLVLDVKESDCPVLSRKHWDDCDPALSKRLSEIVSKQGTLNLYHSRLLSILFTQGSSMPALTE